MARMDQVKWVQRAIGVLLVGTLAGSGINAAPPPAMVSNVSSEAHSPPESQPRLNLLDVVRPEFQEGVAKCVRHPTVSTRTTGSDIVCTVAVYEWLYDHPDRVALAWQRLKVPTVAITDLGGGKFGWTDENGSEVIWQTVGTFPDGRVWYASGKVKPAAAGPSVPIQATFVVSHPHKAEKDGVAVFVPSVQVYLRSDSKAAALALKVIGPAAPRIAEEAATQLLDFFGGIATIVQRYPTRSEMLLGPAKKN